MREMLRKNKTRPKTVAAMAPIVPENCQRSRVVSYPSPQGATSGTETRSCLNTELISVGEIMSNVVGENGNEEGIQQRVGVERIGQELKDDCQNDCNLEFPMIGRQI